MQKARDFGLDLVEISAYASPPVAKIIDFKKFKYLESKREGESKKKDHQQEIKEIRLGPFTQEGDLQVRIKRIRTFLEEGHKVKITVIFRGREITRKEFGFQLLAKITGSLSDIIKVDKPPQMMGRQLITILSPQKTK